MMTAALVLLRASLGLILLLSVVGKVVSPSAFITGVASYRILPSKTVPVFAGAVIATELLAGIMLIFGWLPVASGLVTAGLLALFMGASGLALVRRLNINCGCFGLLYRERIGAGTLGRDGVLLIMAATIALFGENAEILPRLLLSSSLPTRIVAGLSVVLVLAGLMRVLPTALAIWRRQRVRDRSRRQLRNRLRQEL